MDSIYKLFKLFTKKEKYKYIILVLSSFISTFLELMSIALLVPLLLSISNEETFASDIINKIGLPADLINYIDFVNIAILIMILFFLKFCFLLLISYFRNNFIFGFQLELMNKLFVSYLKRDYLFHVNNNSAKILKDITDEVHNVSVGYMGSLTSIILESIMIVVLLIFLLIIQIKTTFVVIIFAGIILYIILMVLKKNITNLGEKREKYNLINLRNIMQAFEGIKEIKIFQKEKEISQNFMNNSKKIKKINWLITFLNEIPRLFFELISILSFLIILLFFVKLNFSFIEIISYFTVILAVFIRIMPSINKCIVSYVNITINKRPLNVIFEELIKKNPTKIIGKNEKVFFNNKIIIKDLIFYYEKEEQKIFEKLNFEIKKGEFIALIGETGAGKTTLIDLIAGLLSPKNGKIFVDDKNIEDNKNEWFEKIGYVPQNIFLNDDSIEKNIAFTVDEKEVDKNKVIEVSKQSQIYEFIKGKKNQFNTIVGERGAMLSGGQRQRLGIARALYNNSEILILDEFTSALDNKIEEEIIKELSKLKGDKTIIISTHRSALLKNCDRVFDVKNKKFVEV